MTRTSTEEVLAMLKFALVVLDDGTVAATTTTRLGPELGDDHLIEVVRSASAYVVTKMEKLTESPSV